MRRGGLVFIGLLISILTYGKLIAFKSVDGKIIADVKCVGYSESGDSIATWQSNEKGVIDMQNAEVGHIIASAPGFSDKIVFADSLKAENNIVTLPHEVALKEIVVTPSDMEEFATHTSYRISQKDMARYANVLQSLNEIPNLTVLSNGSVFFEGNQNIKILIDGVDASTQEVQTLSKEDIAKIDVYQIPPLRFMSQGIDAVVDIRLKSRIHGGNVGLDITQAFQSLKGNNSAAIFYNYKQSRFSLRYDNENKHYRKYRQSEVLEYDFNGIHYSKTKEGLDSKHHYDDNNLNLAYQINKPQNFLYNVKGGVSFNRNGGTSSQNVSTAGKSFLATNLLQTDYTKYIVGNYFEKNLGNNVGTFLANVNYQHFSTFYNSAYNEYFESDIAVNDSHSKYKTHLDAVFTELQYQFPFSKLGYFTMSVFETYKHSKYVDTASPFYQTVNVLGGSAQWMGMKGQVSWWLSMGMNWYHTSSTLLPKSHNLRIPSPIINVNWRPIQNIQLSFDYSYTGAVPTIAQLSETDQWIDTKLVYHGNSTLKPYKTHSAGLRFVWYYKYLDCAVRGNYASSPDMICDMYRETDNYMLQTLVNLSKYQVWSTQIDFTLKPLGNSKLTFWNRIIMADLKGRNQEYSWNGYRFQWMTELALNLEHWTAALFYQYPGKIVEGQLERPRAECWSATLLYRPNTNLSLGVEWYMPFGKGFKESEHTVNSAPVYADTEYKIMDLNNLLSIKLSYNFSYGRNRNYAAPQYDNYDNDSGILHK